MKIALGVVAGMAAGSYLTLWGIAVLDDEGEISRATGRSIAGKLSSKMDNLVFGGRYKSPVNR